MPTYQSENENLLTILHVSRLAQGVCHLDLRVTVTLHQVPIVLERTALYNTTGSNHVLLIPTGQVINLPSHSQLVTSSRDELVSVLVGERQREVEVAAAGGAAPVNPREHALSPEPAQQEEEPTSQIRQSASESSEEL